MLISETLDLASRVTETLSQDHLKILREAGCISMNAEEFQKFPMDTMPRSVRTSLLIRQGQEGCCVQASSSPVSISRQKHICLFSLHPEALVGTADPQKGHPGSTLHGYCHCFLRGTACNARMQSTVQPDHCCCCCYR